MIRVYLPEAMGQGDMDWLSARHHFSFADYVDPDRMQFGPLRVWNDDLFRAGGGFPMHSHRDMEIITYVHTGAITHEDSLGHRGVTTAGNVQVMSAGRGIIHSEFNHGDGDLGLFQIWILPDRAGHAPRWDARDFDRAARRDRLAPLVSGRESEATLFIHQDVTFMVGDLSSGATVRHALAAGRRAYVVPVSGQIRVNGALVPARAAAEVEAADRLEITAETAAEVTVLDLP